ncbi:MAG TPA: PQQ-binding-like beta-propeller repeat protein [Terriglobales bacterium]|nr:PQQ-binding-like beta-propeller repeat protein [Terriglobales bacterium]
MKRHSVCVRILGILGLAFCAMMPGQFAVAQTSQGHDWPHYGNDLANTRFQNLDQINRNNVNKLQVAWVFHTGVLDPLAELEGSPIEVDGRLFITDGHDNVFALNAATGQLLWKFDGFNTEAQLAQFFLCCGRLNKGVAYGDGKVFVGRFDNSVVALNAKTGKVEWQTTVADFHKKVSINSAAQFVDHLVIVSLSGGEFEIRGQVFALDANTGQTIWQFSTTLPSSFAGDSFLTGGAAVWNPPAIDPDLGLLYLSTGNAAPDILGENRTGENLFSTSILALEVNTGAPVWHFQEVHHDIWDYDSAQPAVLFPLEKNGKHHLALGHCSKNGHYILDRRTGEPIFPVTERAVPTGPSFQNAAPTQPYSAVEPLTPLSFDQLTPDEQPDTAAITAAFSSFLAPGQTVVALSPEYTPPDETLRLIMPGDNGGCEWAPAAFSPRTKFVYYGARHDPDVFQTHSGNTSLVPQPVNGDLHLGSTFFNHVPGARPFGIYGATDTRTGKVVWKLRIPQPAKSGVLVAGDLVFFGEGNGNFHAADARTGEILFTFNGPAEIPNAGGAQAGPAAYLTEGREFIVSAFGGNVPDRSITANGNCLGGGSTCDNPVGDAFVAFSLPTPRNHH